MEAIEWKALQHDSAAKEFYLETSETEQTPVVKRKRAFKSLFSSALSRLIIRKLSKERSEKEVRISN